MGDGDDRRRGARSVGAVAAIFSRAKELPSELLDRSRRELEAAGLEAQALAGELTAQELWWKPQPDRWSIGECLDHLVRTGDAYLGEIDEAIEAGRAKELFADGPVKRTLIGRWLASVLEPPPRLALPAPGSILPGRAEPEPEAGTEPGDDPLRRFMELRGGLERRLRAAEGLDLGRIRMSSPFYSFIRFDLGSAFRMLAAHERRHLWQARQVREDPSFPGR